MDSKQLMCSSNFDHNTVEDIEETFTKCMKDKIMQIKSETTRNGNINITETSLVVTKKTDDGNKFINQYMIIKDLGR